MDLLSRISPPSGEIKNTCVYILNLPNSIEERFLSHILSSYGAVETTKVVPNSSSDSTSVGFVNMRSAEQAQEAVRALAGAGTESGPLQLFAGPPIGCRQAPCDNLYVRNMPAEWSEQELHDLFKVHGAVQECRILHRGDDVRGAGALVRMDSVASASQAIMALNGHVPSSNLRDFTSLPLLVRYADSPEEKARKQARKDQMHNQTRPIDFNLIAQRLTGRSLDLTPSQIAAHQLRHASVPNVSLPDAFKAFESSGGVSQNTLDQTQNLNTLATSGALLQESLPERDLESLLTSIAINRAQTLDPINTPNNQISSAALNTLTNLMYTSRALDQQTKPVSPLMPTCTSLYVKNLPPEADRLWMYERFAPHGSILSVKVLQEEASPGKTRCRGVGFVNYAEAQGAMKAIKIVNGMKIADKHLHVSLQTNRSGFEKSYLGSRNYVVVS